MYPIWPLSRAAPHSETPTRPRFAPYVVRENISIEMAGRSYFHGKSAAVSLTFDDGLDVHFTNVMPELEKHGLVGTL